MEKMIRVTGKGNLSVVPDVTRLIFSLKRLEKQYDAALQGSSDDTEELKSALEQVGFEKKDIKTLKFNVETVYEDIRNNFGNWRQSFKGYRVSHSLKVEFPSDKVRVGKILQAVSHCAASPEIRIEYTISDPEAAKNKLLAKAVADSKAKAAILTEAAGVSLGEIITVDYSWGEIDFVSDPLNEFRSLPAQKGICSLDIEPDDIDVTDTVTVIWQIRA